MNRLTRFLLARSRWACSVLGLLAFAGPAWGQEKITGLLWPHSVYDLSRDPTLAADRIDGAEGKGAQNSNAITKAMQKVGYDPARLANKHPDYVQAGRYFVTTGQTIGMRANGTPISGGMFLGAGGMTPAYSEASVASHTGNVTRFVYDGTRLADEYLFRYVGRDWKLGPFELHGFRMITETDRNNRGNPAFFTKCPTGLLIQKIASGFPNGHVTGSLNFMGFETAIKILPTPFENHCDTLRWPDLWFDTCTTCYEVDNIQSIGHQFGTVVLNENIGTFLKFKRGGTVDVGLLKMNGANQTVLEIEEWSYNEGPFRIEVRIDNNGDNPCLVKIGPDCDTGVPVIITGSVGEGVTYTAEDLVQIDPGSSGSHRIYIDIASTPAIEAAFDGESTVAEPPFQ